MISQYLGQKNQSSVRQNFRVNLLLGLGIGMIFMLLGIFCPQKIIRFYTEDPAVRQIAARYLQMVSLSSLPAAGTLMLSILFRCAERPKAPMYASIVAAADPNLRGNMELWRECVCRHLWTYDHRRKLSNEPDQSSAGSGDRRIVRIIAGSQCNRGKTAGKSCL